MNRLTDTIKVMYFKAYGLTRYDDYDNSESIVLLKECVSDWITLERGVAYEVWRQLQTELCSNKFDGEEKILMIEEPITREKVKLTVEKLQARAKAAQEKLAKAKAKRETKKKLKKEQTLAQKRKQLEELKQELGEA